MEVQVEKEIKVPVKITSTAPRENMNTRNRDIMVNTTVTVPTEGREVIEGDFEVNDDDLARRIDQNRANTNAIIQSNS